MLKRINRRKLIKISLTSAVGLWGCDGLSKVSSNTSQQKKKSSGKDADVIVVGAGIAGIEAARVLQSQGYKVVVLEGRDRIGGRIWTSRTLQNIPLDLGASWIQGTRNNPLVEITRQFKIKTLPTDYDSLTQYHSNGEEFTEKESQQLDEYFTELMGELEKKREQMQEKNQKDISLQAAIDKVLAKIELDKQELIGLNYSINTTIEHEYAADSDDLSLYNFDQDKELKGGSVLFPGGYSQIPNKLAENLTIRLEHIVKRIEYSNGSVKVITNKGTFTADKAVITLPLGILKTGTVEFYPALPTRKQTAINKLGMGVLNKVYLRFSKVFWDKNSDMLGYLSQNKGEWCEFLNIYKYTKQPILLCFNAGSYGEKLETLTDTKIIQSAMKVLRTIYGENIPNPEDWLITRWGADQFTKGSYSYLPVGASNADREALAEPVANKLFFAGEATSKDYPATVHGALLSGKQAAKQIINLK
ncbi:MAG TPA: FAD-dependent oxidoreductase [Nostocaceae cyanobacterium]|nr:FAD-dependent oxidoreductase [Nostocaceae cyanobacterium]